MWNTQSFAYDFFPQDSTHIMGVYCNIFNHCVVQDNQHLKGTWYVVQIFDNSRPYAATVMQHLLKTFDWEQQLIITLTAQTSNQVFVMFSNIWHPSLLVCGSTRLNEQADQHIPYISMVDIISIIFLQWRNTTPDVPLW